MNEEFYYVFRSDDAILVNSEYADLEYKNPDDAILEKTSN